jgi:hypothetical protein
MRVDACGNDLCIFPYAGGSIPLGLGSNYAGFFGASWSPDGSRIVFAACPMANLTNDRCQELFIADRDGKKVTPLARNPLGLGYSFFTPIWSPGGEWIAYDDDGAMGIIRPDGTGKKRVLPFLTTLGIAPSMWSPIAWSPNSEQIAMLISVRHLDTAVMDPPDRVWVVNRDGSGKVRTILNSDVPIVSFAWSPDGQYVVVALEDGKAYRIDANCDSKPAGCDASSRTEVDSVPEHWLSNFYPQWAGEEVAGRPPAATPTPTLSPQAEQARTFAEPILAAIANRPPDFSEDFSKPTSGWIWQGTTGKGERFAFVPVPASSFQDGALILSARDANFWNPTCSNFINHVTRADLTLVDLTQAGAEMSVLWRIYPNADHYRIRLRLVSETWELVRHGPSGTQPAILASGSAHINGLGTANRIAVIVNDSQFAIYLNDAPLAYFEDDALPLGGGGCVFDFAGSGDVTVALDNVKVWNLANVPGLP